MDAHLGELAPPERAGGRWQLRFVRRLPHPPGKVWRALTEPEHVSVWFPADIEGERVAGARLRFPFREDEGPTEDGEMLVYDEPDVLEFTWGDERLRFELVALDGGAGTELTFFNTFDEQGKAARDAAGWHVCLDALVAHLAGGPPPWGPDERPWETLNARYAEVFGPEAATIGPPEGAGY